jgi:hypothetical protein
MKKIFASIVMMGAFSVATAQMPVPLLDDFDTNAPENPALWEKAAPMLQAGLECRQRINPNTPILRPLLENRRHLIPPRGFSVFGFYARSVTLRVVNDREIYSAVLEAPVHVIAEVIQRQGEVPRIGRLTERTGEKFSLTILECVVMRDMRVER